MVIDATLADGSLTYGECFVPGRDPAAGEVLLSAHVCHPSLANDNLSGIAVAAALARRLLAAAAAARLPLPVHPRHHRLDHLAGAERGAARRIRHGLVLANLGDPGGLHYKRSRRGDARDRPRRRARARAAAAARSRRLHPLRLRRAPVLLAGHRPAGRLPVAHPLGPVPGIPHLGRRPRLRAPRGAGRLARRRSGDPRHPRARPRPTATSRRRASRSSAAAASTTRSAAAPTPRRRQMALLWVLNLSDGGHEPARHRRPRRPRLRARRRRRRALLAEHGLLAPAGHELRRPDRGGHRRLERHRRRHRRGARRRRRHGARPRPASRRPRRPRLAPRSTSPTTPPSPASPPRSAATASTSWCTPRASSPRRPGRHHCRSPSSSRQWRINLRAPYLLPQALLPQLVARQGQVVLLNSSVWGNARAGSAAYAASKYALKALADALRAEVNPDGLRVLSVYPGRTASPMQAEVHRAEARPYAPRRCCSPRTSPRRSSPPSPCPAPPSSPTSTSARPGNLEADARPHRHRGRRRPPSRW